MLFINTETKRISQPIEQPSPAWLAEVEQVEDKLGRKLWKYFKKSPQDLTIAIPHGTIREGGYTYEKR